MVGAPGVTPAGDGLVADGIIAGDATVSADAPLVLKRELADFSRFARPFWWLMEGRCSGDVIRFVFGTAGTIECAPPLERTLVADDHGSGAALDSAEVSDEKAVFRRCDRHRAGDLA